jgi:HPt (histidine-containing phosphotransfer) domain-containing protein
MADRDAIQAQLAQLKGVFLAQVGARLAELDQAWAAGDLAEVHRLAHKLAGTAGTFGAAEISALARSLEHHLGPAREGTSLPEGTREAAWELLQQLRTTATGGERA